jgi:hypothetical protein
MEWCAVDIAGTPFWMGQLAIVSSFAGVCG